MVYHKLSKTVLDVVVNVRKSVGSGLLEKVYSNALFVEFGVMGVPVKREVPFPVYHRQVLVGEYFADLVIDEKVIIEVKAVKKLTEVHTAQLINYLNISNIRVGYLVNMAARELEFIRLLRGSS